jgi:hypothetical protein
LTKSDIDKLKEVFNGLEVKELIFDECPYKAYLARVSGQPTIKYIPFEGEDGEDIYKGEGTLNFTCYQPYAQTPTNETEIMKLHDSIGTKVYAGVYLKANTTYTIELDEPGYIEIEGDSSITASPQYKAGSSVSSSNELKLEVGENDGYLKSVSLRDGEGNLITMGGL